MAGVVKKFGGIPELEAERFQSDGSRVFILPKDILDKASFFEAAKKIFPLNPPIEGRRLNWDALSDSIWQGFLDLNEKKIAVVWPIGDPNLNEDLTIALGIFEEASITLADSRFTVGNPKELTIVLI
jgi:hypothetical protein